MTKIENNNDLLKYLANQAETDRPDWFTFKSQKITMVNLCHNIATYHADKMTPEQIVKFVKELNNSIYGNILKSK